MRPPESPDVLTGGEWQMVGGVLRWVPAEPEAVKRPDVALLVACPFCYAKVNQSCRSAGGNPREPHTVRLAPRLCSCGARLERKKQMCETCRARARKQTYTLRERRRPTRQRRKAAA